MNLLVIITVPALFALLAMALLRRGWRGRAIDDHPICRRCGFDLIGRPDDSSRCSECGSELNAPKAIIVGHREHRPSLLVFSAIFLLLGGLFASRQYLPVLRDFDPTPYKPDWWLAREWTRGSSPIALDELLRRASANELSPERARSLAEFALALQANRSKTWDKRHGFLIEIAHAQGHLSPTQWQRYARQTFDVSLVARPSARRGDPMPMQIRFAEARSGGAEFIVRYQWKHITIDDQIDCPIPADRDVGGRFSSRRGAYRNPVVGPDESLTESLEVGTHHAKGIVQMEIWDAPADPRVDPDEFPDEPPLEVLEQNANAKLHILDAKTPVDFIVVQGAMRGVMRQAMEVRSVTRRGVFMQIRYAVNNPAIRLCGKMVLRYGEKEVAFDEDILDVKPGSNWYGGVLVPDIGDATQVNIAFVPDPERVRRSTDPTPTWGEEIVFKDIPVRAFPRRRAPAIIPSR